MGIQVSQSSIYGEEYYKDVTTQTVHLSKIMAEEVSQFAINGEIFPHFLRIWVKDQSVKQ